MVSKCIKTENSEINTCVIFDKYYTKRRITSACKIANKIVNSIITTSCFIKHKRKRINKTVDFHDMYIFIILTWSVFKQTWDNSKSKVEIKVYFTCN